MLSDKKNVEFVLNANIKELIGTNSLEAIKVESTIDGANREIKVSGLFIAIGQMPETKAFESAVDIDKLGYIIAKEDCKTNVPSVFVAGDCRTKSVRQLTTAAADGAVAAIAAASYIDEN